MFCIHAPVTQHHSLCIKRRLMQNGIKLSGFYHIIVRNLNIILLVRGRPVITGSEKYPERMFYVISGNFDGQGL